MDPFDFNLEAQTLQREMEEAKKAIRSVKSGTLTREVEHNHKIDKESVVGTDDDDDDDDDIFEEPMSSLSEITTTTTADIRNSDTVWGVLNHSGSGDVEVSPKIFRLLK